MNKKIEALQVLRALAFLSIFFQHTSIIKGAGGWGVSIFLVLSGFMMVKSYMEKVDIDNIGFWDSIKFGYKKISKLFLLHILMLVFSVASTIVAVSYGVGEAPNILAILLTIPLLETFVPNDATFYYCSVSWYLSVTLFTYVCFPFVLKYIKGKSVKQTAAMALLTYAIQCMWVLASILLLDKSSDLYGWCTYVSPLFRIGDFIIGCCGGYIFSQLNKNKIIERFNDKYLIATELVCFAVIVVQIFYRTFAQHAFFSNTVVLFTPTSFCVIALLMVNGDWLVKGRIGKLFVAIGNWSAYMYLIHPLVIRVCDVLFRVFLKSDINKYIFAVLTFVLTIFSTWIYVTIDKKIYRKIARNKSKLTKKSGENNESKCNSTCL